MNKKTKKPNLFIILNIMYIFISLVSMAIFLFTTGPIDESYIGAQGVAAWGVVLSCVIVVVMTLSLMVEKFGKSS